VPPLVVAPLVVGPEPLVEVPAPPAPLGRVPPPSSDPMAQEKSVIPAANNNANNETDKEFFTLMVRGLPGGGKGAATFLGVRMAASTLANEKK
jgi:hypothetical protein